MADYESIIYSRQDTFEVEEDLRSDRFDLEKGESATKIAYHLCGKSALIGEFVISEEGKKILAAANTSVRGRGNASWQFPKKPYRLKFEEKQQLATLVNQTLSKDNNHGIQVYIGNETPVQTMKDCSVVTATYELGEGMQGTIGIIGPKRMDYEHVMKTLKTLMNELDAIFHKEE